MVIASREAMKIAKEVMKEAGYVVPRITKLNFDDDDDIYMIEAYEGETFIEIQLDATGEVLKFDTEE